MQFQMIMKSRTLRSGYSWIYKPSYFSQEMMDACDKISDIYNITSNNNFIKNQGFINFYFICFRNGCALFRIRESDAYDYTGKTIYSVEGIACESSQMKNMWYNLAGLIDYMIFNDTVYRNEIVNDITLNDQFVEKRIEIPVEGYLPKIYHLDNYLITKLNFIQLANQINNADKIYSFVFGSKNIESYSYKFAKYYIFPNDNLSKYCFQFAYDGYCHISKKSKKNLISYVKINRQYHMNICKIYVNFTRKGSYIYVAIIAKDRQSNIICECEPLQYDKHNMDLSLMDSAAECVFKVLYQKGYRRIEKSFVFAPFKREV